jgi:peroxiredoxin
LVGFEKIRSELDGLNAKIVAASVDPIDKANEVAAEVSFPVAYGVSRADANALGSYWEDRRSIVQPSEFIVDANGKILFASYSDGPLGRLDPADVIRWINYRESQK